MYITTITRYFNKKMLYGLVVFAVLLSAVALPTFAANPTITGQIEPPPGTDKYIAASGVASDEIAVIFFISRIIRMIMLIAGVWAGIMILLAGYTFISAQGNSDAYQKVRNQLTNAVVGLLIIMLSFTLTGLVSLIVFGDAGFILNPELELYF